MFVETNKEVNVRNLNVEHERCQKAGVTRVKINLMRRKL